MTRRANSSLGGWVGVEAFSEYIGPFISSREISAAAGFSKFNSFSTEAPGQHILRGPYPQSTLRLNFLALCGIFFAQEPTADCPPPQRGLMTKVEFRALAVGSWRQGTQLGLHSPFYGLPAL